jgi:transcription elongation GreA/GreB family factor
LNLKTTIHAHCLQLILGKQKVLQDAIAQATEAANQDSKSSAGDKHETGKAMMQLEQEKLGKQLQDLNSQIDILYKIADFKNASTVQLGSLITTNQGIFYLAIGLGKIEIQGAPYFIISPQSPIGLKMLGKKIGDEFEVNGRSYIASDLE